MMKSLASVGVSRTSGQLCCTSWCFSNTQGCNVQGWETFGFV